MLVHRKMVKVAGPSLLTGGIGCSKHAQLAYINAVSPFICIMLIFVSVTIKEKNCL